ncbi:CheR family methyltransferase [Muricoccus vinaceus]|uniref:CheR family methyltransferase n=1 Tax=Muricoccus vinaceus TaxID=424704 RepID=A0ABV6IT33_9PROT
MIDPGHRQIARAVQEVSGLVLGPDHGYLLASRLGPVLCQNGLADLTALAQRLALPGAASLARQVAEALTTNETSFFRDRLPFDHLATSVLPKIATERPRGTPIRVWSAACSTGQEAYSVAMLAREIQASLGGRRVTILGTDICSKVVSRAREGLFSKFEVHRGLSHERLERWFTPEGPDWRVRPELREDCSFEVGNLIGQVPATAAFDVILLRNILIYLDKPTKEQVVETCLRRLAPGGVLYLGASETLLGLSARLVPLPDYRGAYGHAGSMRGMVA